MTVYGSFGIFQGGVLTKNGNSIQLSSHKIRLASGQMTGNGTPPGSDVSKTIYISFGHPEDSTIYQRQATLVPQFYLQIGLGTTNTCWLYYDIGIDDLGLSLGAVPPSSATVIFGKLTWSNATSMAGININLTERTESYIAETSNVTTAENLYWDGQRWIAGAKNRPLVNISVLAQVLESESLYILGQEYFITQCKKIDIRSDDLSVGLQGFHSFARKPNKTFSVYDTKTRQDLIEGSALVLNDTQIQAPSGTGFFTVKTSVGRQVKITHSSLVSPIIATISSVTPDILTFPASTFPLSIDGLTVSYELIDTPVAFVQTFPNIASVQGNNIYIQLNKSTGEPLISTSYVDSTHYLVATGVVSPVETDLINVDWKIVNNLGGFSQTVENLAYHVRSLHSSGFMSPIAIDEVNVDNTFVLKGNVLNLDGYFMPILDTPITLGQAPNTGSQVDFVYLEITKSVVPWPILSYEVKIVSGIDFVNYVDPFLQPDLITNSADNSYEYFKAGYYRAEDPSTSSDGFTYAVPLAIIHRHNKTSFSLGTNNNGGALGSRPDGKRYDRINKQEIEIAAPVVLRNDLKFLFNSSLTKYLAGDLSNRLVPAFNDPSVYSRYPLQVDCLADTALPGTTKIGTLDGVRTFWSTNYSAVVPMCGWIQENLDSTVSPYNTFPCIAYEESSKLLILQTVSNGEIVKDSNNQPLDLDIRWVKTGEPVVFLNPLWSTGEMSAISNAIDTNASNYILGGKISIFFKVRYIPDSPSAQRLGLTKIPHKFLFASLSTAGVVAVSSSFAISTDLDSIPRFVKDMSRTTTINSVSYLDKLFIKKVGEVTKFHTYEYHYVVAGNGNSNPYVIPDFIVQGSDTYSFVGVLEVINLSTHERIPLKKITWTPNPGSGFNVTLDISPYPSTNTPLAFVMAVGVNDANKQIDLDLGSLSVSSLTESSVHNLQSGDVNQPDSLTSGIYRYSDGSLVYGVSSCKVDGIFTHVAWVGGEMIPCTIEGIGTNLLTIDMKTEDSVLNYHGVTSGNWVTLSPGIKVPASGVQVKIVTLKSYRLLGNALYLAYQYSGLPLVPFKPESGRFYNDSLSESRLNYEMDPPATIIDRGYLLISNDGVANSRSSFASPFSERFPVVQGIDIIGKDVDSGLLGWNDIMSYQQLARPFIEGQNIALDSSLVVNANVVPEAGQIVYACLIKQLNIIRLFFYVVRDGSVILNKPEQAFVCELDQNYRGVIR